MSVTQPDKDRRLLPRWHSSSGTIAVGELVPEGQRGERRQAPTDEHFEFRLMEWESDHSPEVAAELVGSALVLGRTSEVQAAATLLADPTSDVSPILRLMAQEALGEKSTTTAHQRTVKPGQLLRPELYRTISALRYHVQRNPRDAYAWIDLARFYTILGQIKPAERAIDVAMAIAPEDRFVLRTSARFFVHTDDPDRARAMLARARATRVRSMKEVFSGTRGRRAMAHTG